MTDETQAQTAAQAEGDKYSATVRLPRTDFPMKANLPQLEPKLLERWESGKLYAKVIQKNQGRPLFVFHDGPPYANGNIHHGHILNKTLKDMVVKYRNMAGWLTNFVPGWDCHGLPIELNVDKALGKDKANKSKTEFRTLCRKEAEKWIDVQRNDFKRLGVLGEWEHPYLTINPGYEASVVRELARFADGNGLYKGFKPVHWCWSCKTALAEAEVEYENHKSPSTYVTFPITDEATRKALNPRLAGEMVSALIWTTTPWTLPANRAIAVGPASFKYAAWRVAGTQERVVIAQDLKAAVEEAIGKKLEDPVDVDIDAVSGAEAKAAGRLADHPFLLQNGKPMRVPFLPGEHVLLERGTGMVHTAPGHGPEDYVLGKKFDIEIANPVGPDGRYLSTVGVPALEGLHVARATKDVVVDGRHIQHKSANDAVLELLVENGRLLSPRTAVMEHEYPHCWRCKNPIIFRATEQWFISMESTQLRKRALEAIEKVEWIPNWGIQRIRGMLEARPDWCISRQRAWGVPIPAFVCTKCGNHVASRAVINHVADIFEKHGADAWWSRSVDELKPAGLTCPGCKGTEFRLEEDILDVWFESGASFAAVCDRPEHKHLGLPVDLYLEGSDQHRGWFHSTLLTAVGGRGMVPYKSVLTHGFVVDAQGRKYSKSSPNFEPPENIIKKHGAELFRLWVAATDYTGDIRIGPEILTRLSESYRKTRNTLRFMLGNLNPADFDPRKHLVARDSLALLDRYVLARFSQVISRVRQAYEKYEFHVVHHAINEFVTVDLSAFYLDVIKDILYCDPQESPRRRSAQTALYHLTKGMLTLLAPILSFTAEEAWSYLPDDGNKAESVHLSEMPTPADGYDREDKANILDRFQRLLAVRAEVQRAMEPFRAQKRAPLQAKVELSCPFELRDFLNGFGHDLPGLFIVSAVELMEQNKGADFVDAAEVSGLRIRVTEAPGSKCARCWTYTPEVGTHAKHPLLCTRCAQAVG
ncbi:MAG: isoleucine--tRNA ligase [Myxococcota bacterium]